MYNAKIQNNKPICVKCESNNISGIREYKEIIMDDVKYVMFQVKCYNCNADLQYLADIDIDGTTRYEIKHKVSDIKEGE